MPSIQEEKWRQIRKADLVRILVHDLGLPKILAKKAVDVFFEELRGAILRGDAVEVRGG